MSLESKIEELTRVMSELNETMKALREPQQPTIESEQPKAETVQVEIEQPKAETQTPTAEDLKQLCLTLVRKNPMLKAKIKSALDQFGAAKATDVKPEDMPKVIEQIKALEV